MKIRVTADTTISVSGLVTNIYVFLFPNFVIFYYIIRFFHQKPDTGKAGYPDLSSETGYWKYRISGSIIRNRILGSPDIRLYHQKPDTGKAGYPALSSETGYWKCRISGFIIRNRIGRISGAHLVEQTDIMCSKEIVPLRR